MGPSTVNSEHKSKPTVESGYKTKFDLGETSGKHDPSNVFACPNGEKPRYRNSAKFDC